MSICWYLCSLAAEGQAMDIERGCRSKQVYQTRADAKRVVQLMRRCYREAFRLYPCPACHRYHIAHLAPASLRAALVPNFERRAVSLGA
jgi:hypothetical protein